MSEYLKCGDTRYRVRIGLNCVCILQEARDWPSLTGGRVDASIRERGWVDVKYDKAPTELRAIYPEKNNQ